LKLIDNHTAIMGIFKVAMDTFTLAQGWQKGATLANNLGKARSRREGFKQEDYLRGFSVMIQQSSPTMKFHHKGVHDTHSKVGEEDIRKVATWFKILLRHVIPSRDHHVEDSMVVTSRCIAFGSPVASRYAHSNSITSEQEKSSNDINLVLISCSSQ
jgi:hypothetical protein